jgi:hypothetical protein
VLTIVADATLVSDQDEEGAVEADTEEQAGDPVPPIEGPRHGRRIKKANARVTRPEWL